MTSPRPDPNDAPAERAPSARRVRITSPRTGAARATPRRPIVTDIDEQTVLGEVYMRSLMRTQLRLALGILGAFGITVGGLPLLFLVAPVLSELELLGIPLPWWLLGVLAYPAICFAALVQTWAAERAERDFTALVSEHRADGT